LSSCEFFQSATVELVLRWRHQSCVPRYSGLGGYRPWRDAVYLVCVRVRVEEGWIAEGIVEACGQGCEKRGAGQLGYFAGCAVEGFGEGGVLCSLVRHVWRCTGLDLPFLVLRGMGLGGTFCGIVVVVGFASRFDLISIIYSLVIVLYRCSDGYPSIDAVLTHNIYPTRQQQ
jgi:hypothetical protein